MEGKEPLERGRDEIQLIDLLATLIRRRAWVYWLTASGTLLGALLLFILPAFGVVLINAPTHMVEATVQTAIVPTAAKDVIAYDFQAMAMSRLSNADLVGTVFQKTLAHAVDITPDKAEWNATMRRFLSNSLELTPDPKTGTITITVKVAADNQDKGLQFVRELVARARQDVFNSAAPGILDTIKDLRSIEVGNGELALKQNLDLQLKAAVLQTLVKSPGFPLQLQSEPEVYHATGKFSNGVLMTVFSFGSLFIGLALAFLSESVARVWTNPEDVSLLRKAWKKK